MTTKFKILMCGGFIQSYNNSSKDAAFEDYHACCKDNPDADVKLVKVTESVVRHQRGEQ